MRNKKKKYPEYFTVGDLKKLLADVSDELPIGVQGHFGEFVEMDKYAFSKSVAKLIPKNKSWREMDNEQSNIFSITSPDLGPDPD